MESSPDILCSCVVLLLFVAAWVSFRLSRRWEGANGTILTAGARSVGLPRIVTSGALWALVPVSRMMIHLGISANAVTALSLLGAGVAGIFLACGHFGVAALLFAATSLGDALDGLVARVTRTESAAGALFDASADRYEEFFALGALAIYFRTSGLLLTLVLLALAGSFMVSYGSAKAEALHVEVPAGAIRRAERATCLSIGTTLVPIVGALSGRLHGPTWLGEVPVLLAIGTIAIAANVSAVRRLREVAIAVSPRSRSRRVELGHEVLPSGPLVKIPAEVSVEMPVKMVGPVGRGTSG